jgi:serine/threonine protein phosphatase PrpC
VIRIEFGSDTNVGRVREHNEDALEAIHFGGGDVLIVCDGMGGHAAGDVASRIACSTIAAALVDNQFDDPRELIFRALESAHQRVLAAAEASGHTGMGTTAVVALIRTGALFLGHVGDSRAYLVRGGKVSQLTRDQTKVQEMVDQGILSDEDAKSHPDAGVLAQAIGQPRGLMPFVTPDDGGIGLAADDVLLLCSDGVYDSLSPDDIRVLTANRTPGEAAHALVTTAVERDGQDNATAVVGVVRADGARRGVPPTVVEQPRLAPRLTTPDGEQGPSTLMVVERWGMRLLVVGLLLLGLPMAFVLGRCSAPRPPVKDVVPRPTVEIPEVPDAGSDAAAVDADSPDVPVVEPAEAGGEP